MCQCIKVSERQTESGVWVLFCLVKLWSKLWGNENMTTVTRKGNTLTEIRLK